MSNVKNIGIWKKNCTPVEKLKEVLQYAESGEGKVGSTLIVFFDKNGAVEFQSSAKTTVAETIFMLEQVKFLLFSQ
jgi:hypothetical protein